jgi:HEPN domain-containing protein
MVSGGSPGDFTPQHYREAAIERMGVLQGLYDNGEYALAVYATGLAVECILRAYRVKVDPEFSSRHDLRELSKESKLLGLLPQSSAERYALCLGVVSIRWSNSHRYRTRDGVLRFLKRIRLDRGIKGDALKENTRRIFNAAVEIVNFGDRLWKN